MNMLACRGTNQVRTTKSLKTNQTAVLEAMKDELVMALLAMVRTRYEPQNL